MAEKLHGNWLMDWLSYGFTSHSTQNRSFQRCFPHWLGTEKQNLTQQKHAFTNQKKCTTTQNKHKKTKARFSRLLWHLDWKWRGPILILALHKSVTYLLTSTLTHLQPRDPHRAWKLVELCLMDLVPWGTIDNSMSSTLWHAVRQSQKPFRNDWRTSLQQW